MNKRLAFGGFLLISILLVIFSGNTTSAFFNNSTNLSPSDTVKEDQIVVFQNKVVLDLEDVIWVTYEASGSMKPVLDEGANGLEIVPQSEDDIFVGDIISYKADWNDTLIVHRVIDIGFDDEGKYFVLKGDNNSRSDPGRIRFNQIKYKTIAIIY